LRDEDSGSDSSGHTDINTRLYGGDIYLLGGHHYIRDNDSSASTATTAFGLNELSAKATLKKKSVSRKRRTTGKGNRVLKGITNSILEEDEDKKTDYGDG
jgi:ribosomal protein S19E (S16A)